MKELDIDVTVVEDEEWDDEPTSDLTRKRTTTAVQSPIVIELLCLVCKDLT